MRSTGEGRCEYFERGEVSAAADNLRRDWQVLKLFMAAAV